MEHKVNLKAFLLLQYYQYSDIRQIKIIGLEAYECISIIKIYKQDFINDILPEIQRLDDNLNIHAMVSNSYRYNDWGIDDPYIDMIIYAVGD